MTEAKLAPNLPDWQVQHANRYLASGGTEGHMYKIDVPGRGEITAPALLPEYRRPQVRRQVRYSRFLRKRTTVGSSSTRRAARPNTPAGIAIYSANPMSRSKSVPGS